MWTEDGTLTSRPFLRSPVYELELNPNSLQPTGIAAPSIFPVSINMADIGLAYLTGFVKFFSAFRSNSESIPKSIRSDSSIFQQTYSWLQRFGPLWLMGADDQGFPRIELNLNQFQDLLTAFLVHLSGRFIQKQYFGIQGQQTREGNPFFFLLPTIVWYGAWQAPCCLRIPEI